MKDKNNKGNNESDTVFSISKRSSNSNVYNDNDILLSEKNKQDNKSQNISNKYKKH